ncbi:AfsR/SARP family transcriptional regulator [Solwaraspora sp. WMMA2065]|uniref:AfsR/SARP family transcriptional regulator n=1 Tax=Solwaraspora sp. WMMA2065 TaxID=3015166 RepID=UPI00259B26DE|nr:AfsR/SARP family transcriptional regulator [Solwaraspora sp. WMMA2065]WJK36360.1 BTAD domain-containing putative transcriptional regulator [Solwaraspora sp. WMMA2065]
MAILALEANRVVTVERLIDAVWEESPPSTARGQVQICLSTLRRTFAGRDLASPFETHRCGYLLRVGDGQLDVDVFNRLIAEARSIMALGNLAAAAEPLRAALALWSGPALAGLPGRVIAAGRKRLEESRTAAIEERIRLDLALGRHEEVIGELIWLIERGRLRERLYALLMLALYRSGRQAEALDTYHAARTAFIDMLGIEPGDELRRLEQGILRGDTQLELSTHHATGWRGYRPAAPRPTPCQLPSDTADFIGREAEIAAACNALAPGRADGRAVPVVSVTGRAGIGKSALALHVAHRMLPDYPDGQLYASLDATQGSTEQVLRRFLRALGVDRADIPVEIDEQTHLYRSRLAGQRILVVLDGVTDESQVQPLLPGSGTCGVLVTSRSALVGLPGAHRVRPRPLSPADGLRLLGRIIGHQRVDTEADAADALVTFCGGLPLALRIAGARLTAREHWGIGQLVARMRDDTRWLDELEHGPLSVRASLAGSYRALPDGTRRLLRRLALLDCAQLPAWVAAALLDAEPTIAEDLLEQLTDAQLVDAERVPGGGQPLYRLPALVRVFAAERAEVEDTAVVREQSLRRVWATCLYLTGTASRPTDGAGVVPSPMVTDAAVDRLRADPVSWLTAELPTLMAAVHQAARLGWQGPAGDDASGSPRTATR